MTIGELKEFIKNLPDDCIVQFEYDGPETYTVKEVTGFIIADDNSEILLVTDHE